MTAPHSTFSRLIRAVIANDRSAFVSGATDDMVHAITEDMMKTIHDDLAPHLDAGFKAKHIRDLTEDGFTVQLWKITCKDNSDDITLRIALDGDRLAGFYHQ